MSDKSFRLRLVTPTESLLDEPAEYAMVPAWDGLMGIMHNRAPIVARLGLGQMTVRFPQSTHGGGDRSYVIDGGFVHVAGNEVIVLAEYAVPAEKIAESDAQGELSEAEKAQPDPEAPDRLKASDRLRHRRERARLKVRVARHSKSRGI